MALLNSLSGVVEQLEMPYGNIQTKIENYEPQAIVLDLPKEFPRSPLRYPGGKNRAVKSIYNFIPDTETKLCSPFLGGGSIELACTTKMDVYGGDIFDPLIAFWQVLLTNRTLLVERVRSYFPLSRASFYNLQKRHMNLTDEVEKAAVFFVLNRSSFSGTTFSGGMSPGHPRFTESAIERLNNFSVENFHVECSDYRDMIRENEDAFLYLDPPYMNGQALYGIKGAAHKGFDHKTLSGILAGRDRWIMSYNDCAEIRELYNENTIIPLDWIYGMSKNKRSNEVLVFSRDIAA